MVVVYESDSLGVHAVTETVYSGCDALMLIEEQVKAIHSFSLLPTRLHKIT